MKQKIYDIPLWDAYMLANIECPICAIEENLESSFINVLFDDMLMTPYFSVKLQEYMFCKDHYRKLYECKDKLGLALIVNNYLQCQKEELQSDKKVPKIEYKNCILNMAKSIFAKKACKKKSDEKVCYLCHRIKENIPDYIEVLVKLWQKNDEFRKLYLNSRGHCVKHYNMILDSSNRYLPYETRNEFNSITRELQLNNTVRLIEELDWFVRKYDYRYKDEPWENSKDALPRSINKLAGNFSEKRD